MSVIGTLVRTINESPEIIEGLVKGTLKLWGGVIRRTAGQDGAGQIVAHIIFPDNPKDMESGISQLQQAMNQHYSTLQSSMNSMQSGIDSIQQQLQTGLSSIQSSMQVLQGLQVANLALSGLNLAVSVAGFAIVCQKLNAISKTLESHTEKLNIIINYLSKAQQKDDIRDQAAFISLFKSLKQYSDVKDFNMVKSLEPQLRYQFELNKLLLVNALNSNNSSMELPFDTIKQLHKRFVYLGMAVAFVASRTASNDHAFEILNEVEETLTSISEQLVASTMSAEVLKSLSKNEFSNIKSIVSLKKESLPALEYQKQTLQLVAARPELEDIFKLNTNEILLIAA